MQYEAARYALTTCCPHKPYSLMNASAAQPLHRHSTLTVTRHAHFLFAGHHHDPNCDPMHRLTLNARHAQALDVCIALLEPRPSPVDGYGNSPTGGARGSPSQVCYAGHQHTCVVGW